MRVPKRLMRSIGKQVRAHVGKVLSLVAVIGVLTGALVILLVWRPPQVTIGGSGAAAGMDPFDQMLSMLVAVEAERRARREAAAAGAARSPATGTDAAARAPIPAATGSARLVLVIDDAGNNLQELRPFLEFPGKLTFAVLPQLPHSARAVELARAHGHDVILHLPMAADSGLYPGPGTISTELSKAEIRRILDRNFASTPGAAGANNHMGSAVTADARTMDIVMAYLAEKGMFFVDSRTTAGSVAPDYAAKYEVPFMQRDVFLDHDRDPAAIRAALRYGLEVAREQGHAVLIGHSSVPAVVEALAEIYPALQNKGYELVSVTELMVPSVETAAVDTY